MSPPFVTPPLRAGAILIRHKTKTGDGMDEVIDAGALMPAPVQRGLPLTYSRPDQGWFRRRLIRGVESLSGRGRLERLYHEWDVATRDGHEAPFAAALRVLRLKTELRGAVEAIPREGPLLVLANHPFGIVDGLSIGHLLTQRRGDVKIMTHSLLCQPEAARGLLLPVDFGPGEAARRATAETRRQAVEWLAAGHALIVFPAGSVATAPRPLARHAADGPWHPFAARLAARPGVQTVLVHVAGQNSRLFQIVSHLSYPLRAALILHETARRIGGTVRLTVAAPRKEGAGLDRAGGAGQRDEAVQDLRRRCLAMAGADGPDPEVVFHWPRHIRW